MAPVRVLLFTRVTGYRHASIPAGAAAVAGVAGLSVAVSDDPAALLSLAGVHGATDGEWSWDWYPELVGARFAGHPPGLQDAVAVVADADHPSTAGLPARWSFRDEWYAFTDVRPGSRLLLSVDGSTYRPGEHTMPAPHPVAWSREVGGGRAWYTSLGHDAAAWADPAFLSHVTGGLRWAAGSAQS